MILGEGGEEVKLARSAMRVDADNPSLFSDEEDPN
jgi:hypothetical protein